MESVPADPPNYRAVVSRIFAVRGTTIKRHSAYAAHIVSGIPRPARHCVPVLDVNLKGHQAANDVRNRSAMLDSEQLDQKLETSPILADDFGCTSLLYANGSFNFICIWEACFAPD
ncbi:TPA: hypothetical protein ACH3X2_012747 [Trebouxia sp. C0005]